MFTVTIFQQVMCSCPTQKIGRQLILHRGLHPLVLDDQGPSCKQPHEAVRIAANAGLCVPGDTVIVAYRDHERRSGSDELALKVVTVSICT